MWLFSKYTVFYMWCNSESTLRNKAKSCAKKTQRLKTFGFSWQHYIKDIIIFIKESGLWVALFVPSIQDYLVRVLDKQEVFGGCWLLFLLRKKGGLVLEGGSPLPSLWQVSFVIGNPPLACLPWGRIGWSSWSGDSKAWLKEVSIVSLFSVMLMGTPGIGRAGFLKVSGNR